MQRAPFLERFAYSVEVDRLLGSSHGLMFLIQQVEPDPFQISAWLLPARDGRTKMLKSFCFGSDCFRYNLAAFNLLLEKPDNWLTDG